MGLDAYIKSYESIELDNEGLSQDYDQESVEEIAYYRKVNWLHNWMQQKYAIKTGKTDPSSFNCVHLILTIGLLLELQKDILDSNIKGVSGFFFGDTTIYPEDKSRVLSDIGKALGEIANNRTVTYSSWW